MLRTDPGYKPRSVPTAIAEGPVTFDDAVSRVKRIARPLGEEQVPLAEAHDRVLALPAIARRSAPPVPVSAMDGYAVRDADVSFVPARLKIAGKSFAGAGYVGEVHAGECVRIFTGAPVPSGADRVVIQEDVTVDESMAVIGTVPGARRHVREAGSDFHFGQVVIPAGRKLCAQHLIAAAAADLNELSVFRRPRVSILCCGDELVVPGTAGSDPESIPESISIGVAALIGRWGGQVVCRAILPDDPEAVIAAGRRALMKSDAIVVIGGASVGEKDFAKTSLVALDTRIVFSGVGMKPGRPVWLGESCGTPVIGLPGNPASALITARLLLAPLIAGLAGDAPASALRWRMHRYAGEIEPCTVRDLFVRAASEDDCVRPTGSQDSADQGALADADVLVRVRPASSPVQSRDEALVEIIDL